MKSNGTTHGYARLHAHGLTGPQQAAVDLLASGKTDTETADLLRLHRVTVTKWRLYDTAFQAALNSRRAEIWSAGVDRLRALIPKALNVLAEVLDNPKCIGRVSVALKLLQLCPPPAGGTIGPADKEEVLAGIARQAWEKIPDTDDLLLESMSSRPDFEKFMETTRRELTALLAEPDPHESQLALIVCGKGADA